jgi:hypothetical protein
MEHGVAGAAGGRRDNTFLDYDGLIAGNPILACTPEIADRLGAAMARAGDPVAAVP